MPRIRLWPWVLVLGVVGTIAAAVWARVSGSMSVSTACMLAVLTTFLVFVPSLRFDLRRARLDKAVEQLSPFLGFGRPTRSKVRVHRWSGLVRGAPQAVVLYYARPVRESDPSWKAEVVTTASQVFGGDYVVRRHNDLRCRMVLGRVDVTKGESTVDPHDNAPARVRKLVTELLGESALITHTEYDDAGDLRVIEIHEPTDPQLAAHTYQRRVERAWSTMMPGRWRARFDLEAEWARFERRPSFPSSIWLPARHQEPSGDPRATYAGVAVRYAIDEDGDELIWRPAADPNLQIVGGHGAGRTSTARSVILQLARQGWPVWIIDAEGAEFTGLRDWPNVQLVAGTTEEQVAALHYAHQLVSVRGGLIADGIATTDDFEPIALVVGDWQQLCDRIFDWYAWIDPHEGPHPPALALPAAILRQAARCRVHVVLTSGVPEPGLLTGELGALLGQRASLGRLNSDGAQLMWGLPSAGVSIPRNCPGRGVGLGAGGVVEIQAYRSPDPTEREDPEQAALLDALLPARARHQRLVMVPPEPELDPSGDRRPVRYSQVSGAAWEHASDRPDLDPLRAPKPIYAPPHPTARRLPAPTPTSTDSPEPLVDYFAGYDEPEDVCITDIQPGDLVLVDETTTLWATATDEPEPDVIDSDLWCLEWRSDDDDDGTVQAGEDELLVVRKPHTSDADDDADFEYPDGVEVPETIR